MTATNGDSLLRIDRLSIDLRTSRGRARVVDRISLSVAKGESVGLVGESGSGKSMTALATVRLLPSAAEVVGGRILVDGTDLLTLPEDSVRSVRGGKIGLVFQNARAALNPLMRVGRQIARVAEVHAGVDRRYSEGRAHELLARVGIADPKHVGRSYPHQLSGGMAQRVLIAAVLAARPKLLIADEPTTGLDATTEVQIFDLLRELRRDFQLSLLMITHDLALVAENCDRVVVMHAGHGVEDANVRQLFRAPLHPYTHGLLASMPRPDQQTQPVVTLTGMAPDPLTLPAEGCRFITRCGQRMDRCSEPIHDHVAEPELGHRVMCRLYD